jgi:thioredoxin 1
MSPVTTQTFESTVATSAMPVILDFTAPWCTACHALEPTILALETQYAGRVTVGRVDVEDSPDIGERLGVQSLPTLLVLQDGRVVARHVGNARRSVIEAVFARAAAMPARA